MGLFTKSKLKLEWNRVESMEDLENAMKNDCFLIFKHSTRCSISAMALNSFERSWEITNDCKIFYLDLLSYREISNKIEELSGIQHQSPQAIVWKNNEVIYNASHSSISTRSIKKIL